jgi:cytosine/adenosine deaminase-related metal-dependent hydrolase
MKEMEKYCEKTKIKAAYIIGYKEGQPVVYRNAEMIFEKGEIIAIDNKIEQECDVTFDYGNAIVSPGFIDINALGDIDHAQLDTEINPPQKLLWSEKYFNDCRREVMTAEEEAFKSQFAYAQLLSRGITTAMPITSVYYKKAGETTAEIEAAVINGRQLGMRLYLGPSYLCGMHIYDQQSHKQRIAWMEAEGEEGLKRAMAFAKQYKNDANIQPVMVPERLELQSEEILLKTKAFANSENIIMRLHAAQSDFEYETIYHKYHLSPVQYLDKLGLLDKKTIIPHALFTSGFSNLQDQTDKDLEILAERQVAIAHCPLVYPRFSASLESFGRFLRKGVSMCMGTDTFPPDMLEAIRMGHAMAMVKDEGRQENHFARFFEAATIGGARALGREDIGRLSVGKKADFIVVDLNDFDIGVVDDPIKTLCMNVRSNNIRDIFINGKQVMKNRKIPDFDYEKAQKKAQAYYDKMKCSFIERSAFEKEGFYQDSYQIQ